MLCKRGYLLRTFLNWSHESIFDKKLLLIGMKEDLMQILLIVNTIEILKNSFIAFSLIKVYIKLMLQHNYFQECKDKSY